MKKQYIEPNEGALTDRMDIGSDGFDEFQSILLRKSRERSEDQRRKIELLSLNYRIEDYLSTESEELRTAGEFLRLFLRTLHIRQNKFAAYIGLKPSNFSKILSGERPVNNELAIIFGKLFNHDPMLWIKIQTKNEIRELAQTNKGKFARYSLTQLLDQGE